jgi:hypothetical protein
VVHSTAAPRAPLSPAPHAGLPEAELDLAGPEALRAEVRRLRALAASGRAAL